MVYLLLIYYHEQESEIDIRTCRTNNRASLAQRERERATRVSHAHHVAEQEVPDGMLQSHLTGWRVEGRNFATGASLVPPTG